MRDDLKEFHFPDLPTAVKAIYKGHIAADDDAAFMMHEELIDGLAVIALPDGSRWTVFCNAASDAWMPTPPNETLDRASDFAVEHAVAESSEFRDPDGDHTVYINATFPDPSRCFCGLCGWLSFTDPLPAESRSVH